MVQTNCLNLCEILPYLQRKVPHVGDIIISAMNLAEYETCERIYIGTSFCGKYFLEQSNSTIKELIGLCKESGIHVTLAVPTFSEGDLELGKKKIEQIVNLAEGKIDEFTVNDFGMLTYLKKEYECATNIGRLFMKDYRDPRYEEYFQMPWKPKAFTDYFKKLLEDYEIKSCEFDLTHREINFSEAPAGTEIGLHYPFCYQTVGRICEYASIDKDISKKFRPNAVCHNNCADNQVKYSVADGNMEYVRFGRTVYFRHPGYEVKGLAQCRLIYFPLDM